MVLAISLALERRGVFYSFKLLLPAFAALRGRGGSTLWIRLARASVKGANKKEEIFVVENRSKSTRLLHFIAASRR
jgi:hypothetical protein